MSSQRSAYAASQDELRVLIAEDLPSDADLMVRVLVGAGLRLTHRVVTTEPEFLDALATFGPHVVLTDNALPRFSGRLALTRARTHDPTLPVIMVSGTAPEEQMVQMLREGLADYIFKDSLLRLPPAVLDALELAEVQRALAMDRAALAASERRFRAVAEASGDALLIADAAGLIVYSNAAAERLFGCVGGGALGRPLAELVPAARFIARDGTARDNTAERGYPAPFTAEVAGFRCSGEVVPLELTVSAWDEDGQRFFSAQARDITSRKQEASARHVLSQVVEQSAHSVVITDTEGAIVYVNPTFERLTGYPLEEVMGKTPRVLKSGAQGPELYERLWREITQGRPFRGEFSNRRKDGTSYIQRSTIFPIMDSEGRIERFVGLGVDVTQERLLEQQLQQAQSMELLGQLAGGIAHDFNNTLTGVLANAALLQRSLPPTGGEAQELVEDVIAAARRGAELVKRLMTLSRGGAGPVRRLDVLQTVDEAARTVRRILPESIEIGVAHATDELVSQLNEGELHQALLNLCNNARDAMPRGGRLDLATRADADRAIIEVRDSGVGMPPEVLKRIFEPFFTTKATGKGTGLGLSMVYGFAKRAGGDVDVESSPGDGTVVRLRLPLATRGPIAASSASAPSAVSPHPLECASRTILLVEDQDELRKVGRLVLEKLGYRVLTAADGEEAMRQLLRHRERLDLVLTDLVLPRGGGERLYREVQAWDDPPRFLLTSGYVPGDLEDGRRLLETVPFLPKPWSAAELEAAVSRVLEGSGS